MRQRSWLPLVLALLVAAPLAAVTPRLVKDINPISESADSSPRNFVAAAGVAFFAATDGDTGFELWRTDGTLPGTFRLTDVCPGECSSDIRTLAATSRSYFFLAFGTSGQELWVTDGTPAGTVRLTSSLRFPRDGVLWQVWIASQGVLYFVADDGIHGLELWRTDGTPAGTALVADVRRGPEGSDPRQLADVNGQLFFRADDGQQGPSLWKSDGTPRGTQLVRDLVPGSASHEGPGSLYVTGRTFYFTGPVPGRGTQLWRSDGTSKGTVPLTNLVPRPGASQVIFIPVVLGNRLLFMAETQSLGQEVWVTDGTAKGTRPLTNFTRIQVFNPGDFAVKPPPFRKLGNRLVFPVNDGVHGEELWTTDGTPRGTHLLRDICPGFCSSTFEVPVSNGNLLYFAASDAVSGYEPWVTDGTPAGTRLVRDLCAGSCSSLPFDFEPAGRWVYFESDSLSGSQLWRTNGTPQGTVLLTPYQIPPRLPLDPRGLRKVVLGRSLLFASSHGEAGLELWRSDGTPQGSRLLADLNTSDVGGSYPRDLRAVGDKVFFYARTEQHYDLWRSDGTEAGTSLFADLEPLDPPSLPDELATAVTESAAFIAYHPGPEPRVGLWRLDLDIRLTPEHLRVDPRSLRAVGDVLFFVATDGEHGTELWRTDGTVAGTRLVVDLEPGSAGSHPSQLTELQGRLYFAADLSSREGGLWRTDGTEAGTVLVTGVFSGETGKLAAQAGRLWFFATDEEHGRDLWSTDGTPAGTRAHDLVPGPSNFSGETPVWDGSRFFLSGGTREEIGLWVWDGTAAAPRRISGVGFSQSLHNRFDPVVAQGSLYFPAPNPFGHSTLWRSDGTEAGTVEVLDRLGQPIFLPVYIEVFAGRVFLVTVQGELYQTDGTPEGTFRLLDLVSPELFGSRDLVRAGSRLFFSRWDRATGTELWVLEAE